MAEVANSFALGRQSALAEAHGLYRMIQPECSVEELRELITLPPHIERDLRAYAKAHVEGAHWNRGLSKVYKSRGRRIRTLSLRWRCGNGTFQKL